MRAAAGFYLGGAGELDRGVAHIQAGTRLMPAYPGWLHVIPSIRFYRRGEFAQARAAFVELRNLRPEFPEDPRLLHHVDLIDGFGDQVLDGLRKAGLHA